MRALEVGLGTGRTLSSWQSEGTAGGIKGGILLGIRRSPEDLRRRIDLRVEVLFANGLLEETRRLAAKGLSRSASQALGTKEALGHLEGRCGLAEALELVKLRTRQFAKSQRTWFRRFPGVRWVNATPEETADGLAGRFLETIRATEQQAGLLP